MSASAPATPKDGWPWPNDLRQAVRTGTQGLRCDLGEIIDFSCHGMRLGTRRRWRPGRRRNLVLRGRTGEMLVTARAVWARHEGFRRYVVGVAFEQVDPEVERMLQALAESHSTANEAIVRRAAA